MTWVAGHNTLLRSITTATSSRYELRVVEATAVTILFAFAIVFSGRIATSDGLCVGDIIAADFAGCIATSDELHVVDGTTAAILFDIVFAEFIATSDELRVDEGTNDTILFDIATSGRV